MGSATSEWPTWFLPSIKALVDVLNLPSGWNSHSAKQIVPQNAIAALKLLVDLMDFETPSPAVVPRVQGNLQLEWHMNQMDIEIYIDSPRSMCFFWELYRIVTSGT